MASDNDTGDAHAHHQQPTSAPDESDCPHSGCVNDCNSVTAVAPEVKTLLPGGATALEDVDEVETKQITFASISLTVATTGPPPGRAMLPADTPVGRCDRLHI